MISANEMEELKDFFSGLGIDDYVEVLAPYMEFVPGDNQDDSPTAGTMERIYLTLDESGEIKEAKTKKITNISFNLLKAIKDKDIKSIPEKARPIFSGGKLIYDIHDILETGIEGLDNPLISAVNVYSFMQSVNKLTTIEIPINEARILKEIVLIIVDQKLEDNTILKEKLISNMELQSMNRQEFDTALANLASLKCIQVIGDEVILIEEVEFVR